MRTGISLACRNVIAVALSAGALASAMALAPAAQASTLAAHAHSTTKAATTEDPWVTSGGTSGVTSGDTFGVSKPNVTVAGTATTYCATISYNAWIKDGIGVTLANYWMYTYYCFDYNTVTYHDTWATGSVTTTGGIGGWQYDGYNGPYFNCYYARGTVGCSGNHEATQGIFKACQYNVCYSTWYPYVQEWETYKGTFSFSYSD